MMSNSEFEVFHLIYQNQSNVIKVIGVGGVSNAIKPHV
jgi:dihydroorotate dehydrogenase